MKSGRYSASDKLALLRRHWAGEPLDLGKDEFGRDLLTKWDAAVRQDAMRRFRATVSPAEAAAHSEPPETFCLDALRWTGDDGEVPGLDDLRLAAGPFPTEYLRPGTTALCLFSARFYGRSDVIRVHDAGITQATLVDLDAKRLEEMRTIYPATWDYVAADCREFLRKDTGRYDVVIADPWQTMAAEVAWDWLPKIMSMTTAFIVNYIDEMLATLGVASDDLDRLSEVVCERTGVPVRFQKMMQRTKPVWWAVIINQGGT
jgi:hypothetical protein